jgi:hypothetical protein
MITPAHELDSIEGFLSKYSTVFSEFYLNSLREKFDTFDGLAGLLVCAVFIQSQSYGAWTKTLIKRVFQWSYERAAQPTREIPQFDGVGKYEPLEDIEIVVTEQTDKSGPTPEHNRYDLCQIELRGQSILDAWNSNDDVGRFGPSQPFPPNWMPQTSGSYDVFRRTSAHFAYDRFEDEISRAPFSAPALKLNQNQMVPTTIPCIYTASPAFRCSLWAAFTADIIQGPPRADQ